MDAARHVIKCMMDSARHVIKCILHPRLMGYMVSYDAASTSLESNGII